MYCMYDQSSIMQLNQHVAYSAIILNTTCVSVNELAK